MAEGAVCDFCSDTAPRYLEDCEDFDALPYDATDHARSVGAWAACETCHTMIQARRWRALKARAVVALQRKYPTMPRDRLDHGVELIHNQFRRHRPVGDLNP